MNRREAGEADRREAIQLIAALAEGAENDASIDTEDGQEFEDAAVELSGFVQRLFGVTAAEIDAARKL